MKREIVELTKKYVKEKLEKEGSGHDWWHTLRVYNNAVDIARTEEGEINYLVIELGALLHDIADHKFGYTDEDRKNIISNFLNSIKVEKDVIEEVIYIANNISFKSGKNKHILKSLEGKIVQDADRLDAMGALGIGRTFAYGGHVGRLIYNPELDRNILEKQNDGYSESDTITHFYEKLLLLKDKMNTKSGKEKALKRHIFMEQFLDEFYKEWNGEI